METVSVIVPVYNVEKFINRCLASICNQTYDNLQIIVIDDGSTDRSSQICDDWATRDDRITVIHQPNKGVSAARNCGIRLATGHYIAFVDSDDWIEPDMYEQLVQTLYKDQDAQLCICEYFWYGFERRRAFSSGGKIRLNKKEAMQQLLKFDYPTSLYFCLYRSSVIKDNYLNETIYYWEDLEYQWRILKLIKFVTICKKPFYHLTINPESVTHQNLNERHFTTFKASNHIKEDIEIFYPEFQNCIFDMQKLFLLSIIELALKSEKIIPKSQAAIIRDEARKNFYKICTSPRLNFKDKIYIIMSAISPRMFVSIYQTIAKVINRKW